MRFDYKKAVQSIAWFAQKNKNKLNYMKAIKLLYFAERYHIRRYGRPIFWDNYIAMKFGPVQSNVYDLIKTQDYPFDDEENIAYFHNILNIEKNKREKVYNIILKNKDKINIKVFSKTDIEALEFSWNTFGKFNEFELAEISHVYPEWNKYEELFKQEIIKSRKMNLIDFFEDPSEEELKKLKKYGFAKDPFELSDEILEVTKDYAEEMGLHKI
ncbi:Panacea domain-containing protein [Marinitoga lauensis]|uniref:Panacea domain-containing protein n=1 Tax=Marinitoga lauensis TaxID=2201189 RepID=UPI0010126947|nr:Panacea domain-containing protein [Marinitoga lauensis]